MNNLQFLVKIIQNKNNLKYQFTLLTLQKLIENDKLHFFQKDNLLRKSAKMIWEDLLKYLRKRICSNNLQITRYNARLNGDDNVLAFIEASSAIESVHIVVLSGLLMTSFLPGCDTITDSLGHRHCTKLRAK